MKTPFDIVRILHQKILDNGIIISGSIYKYVRPTGSQVEDIVISSDSLSMDQDQLGTVEVNLFVPEITIPNQANTVPNIERMNELAYQLFDLLKEYYSDRYSYYMESVNYVTPEDQTQKYLNITVQFRIFNSFY